MTRCSAKCSCVPESRHYVGGKW